MNQDKAEIRGLIHFNGTENTNIIYILKFIFWYFMEIYAL